MAAKGSGHRKGKSNPPLQAPTRWRGTLAPFVLPEKRRHPFE